MKHSSRVVIAVLVAATLVHFSVAWQDLSTLARNGYLYDDSFYAFQIARNIAAGAGPTFDGTTLTNGFQPLYVLMLVPFYWLSGGDPVFPIHLALALLSIFTVATAYVLFRIAGRYVPGPVATAAAAFWVFAPVVIRQTANGLETAVALFFFAASIDYYLSRVRNAEAPSRATMARLGALLGLAVLSRLDQAFLVMAVSLDYLLILRARRRAGAQTGVAGPAVMVGTVLAIYAPWMIYGWVAVGRLVPESGVATRFLSMAYAPFFGMGSPELMLSGPDASFIGAHVARAASVLKLTPITHAMFRIIERAGAGMSGTEAAVLASNIAGVLFLAAVVAWVFLRRRLPRGARIGELSFLILFAVSLIAAYSLYVFGSFFFIRYLYPVHFVATIFLAVAAADVLMAARAPALRRVLLAGCALYAVGHLYMAFNCCYRSQPVYHFYDIARWVESNTDETETIGVFQSGAIGYLSNRRVVNLDGKVNGDALAALRRGELESYVENAGIDVLLDHTKVIRLFLGDEHRFDAGRCFSGAGSGLPGWIGYRLSDLPARAAAGSEPVMPDGSSRAR